MRRAQLWLSAVVALGGCAGSLEDSVRREHDERARARDEAPPSDNDGSLEWYVARAMHDSPELTASFARWRTAVHRVSRQRRLPEPTLSYTYYVRNVETRVGPQRHRLGLSQAFPWPGRLTSGADSAAFEARAEERRFEALELAVRRRVAEAYWALWRIRATHRAELEQDGVLDSIAASVRTRVEIGSAALADLSQLQLRIERHHDHTERHHQQSHMAAARLRAEVGLPRNAPVPTTTDAPEPSMPAHSPDQLASMLADHPAITSYESMALAAERAADREDATRLPTFMLGVDWIETGEARMAGVPDSGKDPLMVSVAVQLPLWQGSYGDASDEQRARAIERRAESEVATRRAEAELDVALALLRDTRRTALLHERSLVPQAEAVYGSVLGGYHTGATQISQLLLAVQDLLELQIRLIETRADHAIAWARLEQVVGRPLARRAGGGSRD